MYVFMIFCNFWKEEWLKNQREAGDGYKCVILKPVLSKNRILDHWILSQTDSL